MDALIVVVLILFALLGAPLFAIFGAAAMILFGDSGTITSVAVDVFSERFADSPTLVTLPLFTFAGYLMAESGTPKRLVRVSRALFGWLPGGLAVVCLCASAFFTTFTGGSGITIVAVGGLLFPALLQEKYEESFSLGLVTTGGSLGLLFPPSIPIVLYAVVGGILIDKLFLAGIIPGIITVGVLAIYAIIVGKRGRREKDPKQQAWQFRQSVRFFATLGGSVALMTGAAMLVSWAVYGAPGYVLGGPASDPSVNPFPARFYVDGGILCLGYVVAMFATEGEARAALKEAAWEVLLPFLLIAALMTGFARIHEAAAFTALYVLVVEVFVTKDIDARVDLPRVIKDSMTMLGAILVILATALGFTGYLIQANVPDQMVDWMDEFISSPVMFLLALNVFLLVVGMLMDIFSAIVVVVPLIVPIAREFGIDPYHLGIVFLLNLEIGYLTPPVGLNLFISSFRFERPVTRLYTAVLPFIGLLVIALGLTTYVPILSTWLPSLMGDDGQISAEELEEMDDPVPLDDAGGDTLDDLGGGETLDDLGGETLDDLDDPGGEGETLDDLDLGPPPEGETLDDLAPPSEGETLDDLDLGPPPEGETLDDL
ncbi:MAG TPA: TRAP transporter large permease subunit [Sandaracinaceae bacterium LLY-WYZ-13_1]|nr:TRAP transporter large permease subunit [Sandaracinaceae bacterium LLY-WYZ-13_1]